MANTLRIEVGLDTKQARAELKDFSGKFKSAIDGNAGAVNNLKSATSGLTSALVGLGAIAAFKQIAQFGIDLDKSRNAMTALTGSVEKANAKMAELRQLAKESPGVTTSFATQLFQQFKAVGTIADQTINTVIKSLGKLNTVFSDVGPEFARNLVQIFQQGFERGDIKEALGRVPIFEQLLKSAFGTDDPAKLKKLKDAGKLTLSQFLDGFSQAINNDPRFKNIQESLGSKLQKSFDETKLRLAELGEKILQVLIPALDKLLPILNSILNFLNQLPDGLKAATIGILAVVPAINSVSSAIASLRVAVAALGGFLTSPAGLAVLGLIGAGVAIQGFSDMIAREQANIDRQLGPKRNIDGTLVNPLGTKEFFSLVDPNALNKKLKVGGGALTFNPATGTFIPSAAAPKTAPTGTGTRKRTGIDLPTLTSDDLISSDEALRQAIAERESAIFAGRARRTELTTAVEATERKDQLAQGRLTRKALTQDFEEQEQALKKAQEAMKKYGTGLSEGERFMRGFASAVETTGDAFERLGENIADSFRDVGSLLSNLKRSILSFFNDLLGQSLQRAFGQILAPIAGLFGGGGGGFALPGGGGLFRTPSTFGSSVSSGALQNFFSSAGSGLSAPPSVSSGGIFSGLGSIFGSSGPATRPRTVTGGARAAAGGFSLSALGQSLGAAAPFLGVTAGIGAGGQSTLGKILGGVGGGVIGLGVGVATGALTGPITALFTNPFTIPAAIGLLVGSIFLGKAAQRRKDEEASGEFLTQALNSVAQLKSAVDAGQITDLGQARQIFENQILATFIQQINTLKTKSVRDSRLTNQVRDLRKNFEDLIPPSFAAAAARQTTANSNALNFSKQIPEFATGGTASGGLALLHPGEKVVNMQQQAKMRAIGGANIFERAGVPGVKQTPIFDTGGTFGSGLQLNQPIEITLDAQVVISEKTATGIYIVGGSSASGRAVTVNNVKIARTNREL